MHWQWITLVYCIYLAAVSFLRPEFRGARPALVAAAAVAGLIAITPARVAANRAFTIIVPSLVLLAGYRLSGLLFVRTDTRAENALLALDRSCLGQTGLLRAYAAAPRILREYLETSYLLVYVGIPAGALALVVTDHTSRLDEYWSVVLAAEFICYGMLPWIQTRPPMLIQGGHGEALPPMRGVRRLNQLIARRGSIQANTIPSGHAAGAMATALVVMSVAPGIGLLFLVLALSIAVASVLGRYHYAIDSVLGILVALLAWAIL
jgi:membrane-associated phospholipid phosphatase